MAAVESSGGDPEAGRSTTILECGCLPENRHTKEVDTSRCFVGDLCCCQYDAFDFANLLLTEGETVVSGRIEAVAGLPDSLLVRRDVRATIAVDGVFRTDANAPPPTMEVRLTSDMFLWPDAGVSRIAARQAMHRAHEAKEHAILERRRSLDAKRATGDLD